MTKEIGLRLLKEIEALKQEIRIIKGESPEQKPTYQYNKIRDSYLENRVDIEKIWINLFLSNGLNSLLLLIIA